MVKGKTDNAAASTQPTDNKSFTQQAGDALSGNQQKSQGYVLERSLHRAANPRTDPPFFPLLSGMLDSAKDALGMNNNKNL